MNIEFSRQFRERYEIGRRLGAGAMGVVFAARDVRLDRSVAIKVLNPGLMDDESLARFKEEARVTASLNHEGIVTLYEAGSDGQLPYMVFELINGFTLRRYLRAKKRLSIRRTLKIGLQVARALAYAHEKGVIHRDIKPDNIMIADKELVKLADFGIARALSKRSCKTRTGLVLGTIAYMAPEQIAEARLTHSADLYSLGVVLFECLSGRPPFAGSTIEVATAHLEKAPPRLPEEYVRSCPGIARLVASMLEKDPSNRPADASVVADALQSLLEDSKRDKDSSLMLSSSLVPLEQQKVTGIGHPAPDVYGGGEQAAFRGLADIGGSEGAGACVGNGSGAAVRWAVIVVLVVFVIFVAVRFSGVRPGTSASRSGPARLVGSPRVVAGPSRVEIGWTTSAECLSKLQYRPFGGSAWKDLSDAKNRKTRTHRLLVENLRGGRWEFRLILPGGRTMGLPVVRVYERAGPVVTGAFRPAVDELRLSLVNTVQISAGTAVLLPGEVDGAQRIEKPLPAKAGEPYEIEFVREDLLWRDARIRFEWVPAGTSAGRMEHTTDFPGYYRYLSRLLEQESGSAFALLRSSDIQAMAAVTASLRSGALARACREFSLHSAMFFGRSSVPIERRLSLYDRLADGWLEAEEWSRRRGVGFPFSPARMVYRFIGMTRRWIGARTLFRDDVRNREVSVRPADGSHWRDASRLEFRIDGAGAVGRELPRDSVRKSALLNITYEGGSGRYLAVRLNGKCIIFFFGKGQKVRPGDGASGREVMFLPPGLLRWRGGLNVLEIEARAWPGAASREPIIVHCIELRIGKK